MLHIMILLYAAEENPNMVSKFFLAFHEIHLILAIHVFNLESKRNLSNLGVMEN